MQGWECRREAGAGEVGATTAGEGAAGEASRRAAEAAVASAGGATAAVAATTAKADTAPSQWRPSVLSFSGVTTLQRVLQACTIVLCRCAMHLRWVTGQPAHRPQLALLQTVGSSCSRSSRSAVSNASEYCATVTAVALAEALANRCALSACGSGADHKLLWCALTLSHA